MTVKEIVRDVLDSLPDDIPWDELEYRLRVRRSVEEAEREYAAGLGVSNEDARERLKKWLD